MARIARAVAPGLPHLVTQRGNRGQPVFFSADDSAAYRTLLAEHARAAGVAVWAWCLLPTEVHLILLPRNADGLRAALGETHRRYTRHVNAREGWRGYLWAGRFASAPLDDRFVLEAARYVEQSPVRAGLAQRPRDWRWSSARAHLDNRDDGLVATRPLLDRVPDWPAFLAQPLDPAALAAIRSAERTGRPLGAGDFVAGLETQLGRKLAPGRRGRKPRALAA